VANNCHTQPTHRALNKARPKLEAAGAKLDLDMVELADGEFAMSLANPKATDGAAAIAKALSTLELDACQSAASADSTAATEATEANLARPSNLPNPPILKRGQAPAWRLR
jgi:hypothetical protein